MEQNPGGFWRHRESYRTRSGSLGERGNDVKEGGGGTPFSFRMGHGTRIRKRVQIYMGRGGAIHRTGTRGGGGSWARREGLVEGGEENRAL